MRFAAFSSYAALVLLTMVVVLVVLFYLLKPRTRRVVVSSTLLWRALAGRQGRTRRWRWLLSILLALCTALSIALALTRPEVAAVGGISQRLVLVLDDSPSMAARTLDGKSRWRHAGRARSRSRGTRRRRQPGDDSGHHGCGGAVGLRQPGRSARGT